MTGHLFAMSIGPVQSFIAAARRTRDLWFGSHMLSEISKAAACTLAELDGRLIFPGPADPSELEPGSDMIMANVVLAELPPSLDPAEAARHAREAAQRRWNGFAQQARELAGTVVHDDVWQQQVDDVVECCGAWVETGTDYRDAHARVRALLAGRKALRDFSPGNGRAGLPKSSLDGARESVLREGKPARRLRLSPGEQLDIVGVTKRLAGGNPTYPSVARVAADPWLRRVRRDDRFQDLLRACGAIEGLDRVAGPQYSNFDFDGSVLYRSRHAALCREQGWSLESLAPVARILDELCKKHGAPETYLAVLVADGDRIGATIAALSSSDEHRAFSQQLSAFARDARGIVERHHGTCIYAGGDDVLALTPLDSCLACARALHDRFAETLPHSDGSPTLSVGIAIGHYMEPLEDLLQYGREAEKLAKEPDRDGLCVTFRPRGGSPLAVRRRWSDGPEQRLQRFAAAFASDKLPHSVAYDLRELAQEYAGWKEPGKLLAALQADGCRVLARKRGGHVSLMVKPELGTISTVEDLQQLADELIIARRLTFAVPRGERP